MQSTATSVEEYCVEVPEEQKAAFLLLRNTILVHLPEGFKECMNYGMIGYVVPKTVYPAGYHGDPKLPLPFMGLAAQKNTINFYHMGLYADLGLLEWFQDEYVKQMPYALNMGKSCIRFKNYAQIPFGLIGELVQKMSVEQWVSVYESSLKR